MRNFAKSILQNYLNQLITEMTSLTMLIVAVFVIGYFFIAIESVTKVNKAAIALLMFVGCWTIFMFDPMQ